jgi:cobalamin biosynthesis protein CobT
MSLSDIFTPSVVISLAISLLLIGLLGLYVSNKMNEQNHKLNTMFDLVSTLANELQMVRSQVPLGMGSVSMGGGGGSAGRVYEKPEVANTNHLVNMIDVSDDSDSSGDESDGETDEGAESDDDSGSDDDGEDAGADAGDGEEDSGSDGDDEESDGDSDGDDENDVRSDKAIIVSESLDDALFEELANLDEIVLEDTKVERVKTPETTPANTSSVKNLNVVFDYKKASLSKLREIVEQKGLSSDTSKLKKQELLKMLEID